MRYPTFFDQVRGITMYDPLARFLGAAEGGILDFRYVDAVKSAGHSCPTVAVAWLMTAKGLEALYPRDIPERGGVRAEFSQDRTSGVTGVIANIVSLVTGATHDTGFKGIAGRFDRRNLLAFNAPLPGEIRFTRLGTGAAVVVSANPAQVPGDPRLRELMAACLGDDPSDEAEREFAQAWQERVRAILIDHADDAGLITVAAA